MAERRKQSTEPALLARWVGPADGSRNAHGVPARDLTAEDVTPDEASALVAAYPSLYAAPAGAEAGRGDG